jgi:hypothetical protein
VSIRTPCCLTCGAALGRTRLVLDRRWACPDCAYEREYGPTERKTLPVKPPRRETAPLQSETLFPLPRPVPKTKR